MLSRPVALCRRAQALLLLLLLLLLGLAVLPQRALLASRPIRALRLMQLVLLVPATLEARERCVRKLLMPSRQLGRACLRTWSRRIRTVIMTRLSRMMRMIMMMMMRPASAAMMAGLMTASQLLGQLRVQGGEEAELAVAAAEVAEEVVEVEALAVEAVAGELVAEVAAEVAAEPVQPALPQMAMQLLQQQPRQLSPRVHSSPPRRGTPFPSPVPLQTCWSAAWSWRALSVCPRTASAPSPSPHSQRRRGRARAGSVAPDPAVAALQAATLLALLVPAEAAAAVVVAGAVPLHHHALQARLLQGQPWAGMLPCTPAAWLRLTRLCKLQARRWCCSCTYKPAAAALPMEQLALPVPVQPLVLIAVMCSRLLQRQQAQHLLQLHQLRLQHLLHHPGAQLSARSCCRRS